ncbi:FecCD family ABC transporter permease [Elioraea rosea]|uniref:FecCD family ABC transporter permease n=1 Tax=Elioraea rosea TaxID=2492390 RepID=UPI0011837BA3|nr:iron chelate uptake ABC transporter family permease subunit [Elioraea rosea]
MTRALAALAGALALLSLLVGRAGFGVVDTAILWELRAPRTVLALAVGAGLGLSGAVLQGLLRNRLADPGLLGVTGGASLGAVLVYYYGLAATLPVTLPLGGLAGAGLAAAAILALASRTGTGAALLLAGLAVASLTGAAVAVALSFAPNPFALAEITVWLLGSLEDRGWREVLLALPAVLAGAALLLGLGRRLDALSLGEAGAASLGVDVPGTVRRAALGAALAVGATAAVAGGVGFVGLIAPNLVRGPVGERPGALLLPAMFAGAAIVAAADIAVRLVPLQQEMRLGVVTALIGAPLLLRLVVTRSERP